MTTIKTTTGAKADLGQADLTQDALKELDTDNDNIVTRAEVRDGFDLNGDGALSAGEKQLLRDYTQKNGIGVRDAELGAVMEKLSQLVGDGKIKTNGEVSVLGDVDININDLSDEAVANFLQNLGETNGKIGSFLDKANASQLQSAKDFLKGQLAALSHTQRHSSQAITGQSYQQAGQALSGVTGWIAKGPTDTQMPAQAAEAFNKFVENGLPVDPMAFVQWVLRESYLETTETLYDYAKKVQYFNEAKRQMREYLTDLRDFNTGFTTHMQSKGLSTTPPDQSDPNFLTLNEEYNREVHNYFSQHGFTRSHEISAGNAAKAADAMGYLQEVIADKALDGSVNDMMTRANERCNDKFGCDIPEDIREAVTAMLTKAIETDDRDLLNEAMSIIAAFYSYAADAGTKGGEFGEGGNDDLTHYGSPTPDGPTTEDFLYYMGSDAGNYISDWSHFGDNAQQFQDIAAEGGNVNATARSNLASGDISLINEAFGFDANILITGGSSLSDVVTSAMSPLGDEWKNDILHGQEATTQEMVNSIQQYGVNSQYVTDLIGEEAVGDIMKMLPPYSDSSDDVTAQVMRDFDIPNKIPPNGMSWTKEGLDNEIEKWEQNLNQVGDDAQLANVDLQNWLQKQQQTMQMMSNISKMLHDTAMAIIRKIG